MPHNFMPNRRQVVAGLAAAAAFTPLPLSAQAWKPSKTFRIVVPFAAGGISDVMARRLGSYLEGRWKTSVIVDNKAGAAGIIGTMEVVNSAPDGHTVLLGTTGPQAVAYNLFNNLPYKREQLLDIANLITGSNMLLINPDVPAKTVPEFVAWLKANKGKIAYASSGPGTSTHLSASWFLTLTGTEAKHVPYRGSAPAINDLIAGTVSFYFDNLASGIEFVRSGKLRSLGITSAAPSAHTDLPPLRSTMKELNDYDVVTFYGIYAPAGVPAPAVAELNAAIGDFVKLDSTKEYFKQIAADAAWDSPEATKKYIDGEIKKWGSMIQKEGLKLDIK